MDAFGADPRITGGYIFFRSFAFGTDRPDKFSFRVEEVYFIVVEDKQLILVVDNLRYVPGQQHGVARFQRDETYVLSPFVQFYFGWLSIENGGYIDCLADRIVRLLSI